MPDPFIRRGVRRIARLALRRRTAVPEDIDAEIAFHVAARIDELMARGRTRADAEREAWKRFGNHAQARTRLINSAQRRDTAMNLRDRFDSIRADVRFTLRGIRRSPAFVAVAVATMALGIGANAAVFNWMDTLLLNPLPAVQDASRLFSLTTQAASGRAEPVSYPDFLDWRAGAKTLRDVVAYRMEQLSVRVAPTEQAEGHWGLAVSPGYFEALGVRTVRGRSLRADSAAGGDEITSAEPIVVIGYELWQRRFAGSDRALGQTLWVNGHPLHIVGVAPPRFRGTDVGFAFDLWFPLALDPQLFSQSSAKFSWRAARWLQSVGRLSPSATPEQARAELKTIGAQLALTNPEDRNVAPTIVPVLGGQVSSVIRPALLALISATLLVLGVVILNLASLQVVNTLRREQEITVRLALGAEPSRIVQLFLIDAGIISLVAIPLALVVAAAIHRWLVGFVVHTSLPVIIPRSFGAVEIVGAAALAALVTIGVGVLPALRATRSGHFRAGMSAGRTTTSRDRTRQALIVGQLACALIVVAAAGLFVHSLANLRGTDTAWRNPANTLLVTTDFNLAGQPYAGFDDDTIVAGRRIAVADEILRRARSLPGVTMAALTDAPPLGLVSSFDSFDVRIPGYVPAPGETTSIVVGYATANLFETTGPALLRGRAFAASDRKGMPFVAVVNDALARRYFVSADAAIGRAIRVGAREMTIVGVVRDAKYRALTEQSAPFLYLSFDQWSPHTLTLAVRVDGAASSMVAPLRRMFHDVDPTLPFLDARTLADQIDGALTLARLGAILMTCLGGFAFLIATLGLYAAVLSAVQQRRREIGIRMALGANGRTVLAQFAGRGLRLALMGFAIGIPGAFAVGRVLHAQVFGVAAADWPSLLITMATFIFVTIAASVSSAWRVLVVDPAETIRAE